ncbi:redoxin domain-containing protein [Azoarcus communis]|uniref:TlpA family protein disulfide reductase n=1 Tax=Parazoarcus communis TaxID=41977 RepID=UPI0014591F3B|nr:TlpA disulfide reductase family protein [Parazoarcus communis]NMG47322.1 redoxin domain-containing protein [Parazoarcus communis]
MNRYAQYALIALVAALAGAAGYITSQSTAAPSKPAPVVASGATEALLALNLPDLAGQTQAMSQWRGKVIVVNFWATWCPPCRKEIPDFAAASRTFEHAPVQFVGLSIDTVEKVQAFNAEFAVPYPLLIASSDVMGLAAGFGNVAQGLPFTVIIDRSGTTREVKLGTLKQDELERKIRALLDEQN